MHIGIVGGVERGEQRYAAVAASLGHTFEFHGGNTAGRGSDSLEALVERSDIVICVTDVNSHAAVIGARRYARAHGRRCVLTRRVGLSRFRALLAEIDTPNQLAAAL
jgi:phosphoglycerate dehydrogenase-like enzyme